MLVDLKSVLVQSKLALVPRDFVNGHTVHCAGPIVGLYLTYNGWCGWSPSRRFFIIVQIRLYLAGSWKGGVDHPVYRGLLFVWCLGLLFCCFFFFCCLGWFVC